MTFSYSIAQRPAKGNGKMGPAGARMARTLPCGPFFRRGSRRRICVDDPQRARFYTAADLPLDRACLRAWKRGKGGPGSRGHRGHAETGARRSGLQETADWFRHLRFPHVYYSNAHVPLYSYRHTGISLLIAAGCDVKEVSARAGHSRTSTTLDKNTHLFEKASRHTTDVMSSELQKVREKSGIIDIRRSAKSGNQEPQSE